MMFWSKRSMSAPDVMTAIADGQVIPLEKVNDPVFSQRMMGDGLAFVLSGDHLVAPGDGYVMMLHPAKHAIGLHLANGLEVLIHIGLDTVELGVQGLKAHVKLNSPVKAGQRLITIDRPFMDSRHIDLTTPMILTNHDLFTYELDFPSRCVAGTTPVIHHITNKVV